MTIKPPVTPEMIDATIEVGDHVRKVLADVGQQIARWWESLPPEIRFAAINHEVRMAEARVWMLETQLGGAKRELDEIKARRDRLVAGGEDLPLGELSKGVAPPDQ